ncbi:MAG: hypothetical protein IKT52_15120 [Oscillospiraceae bacterium]|nr:hypothetical protein [Oscillospiraceae bacterium]
MKSKKQKKQRSNVHTYYPFNDEVCSALSNALFFLLNLEDFSFDEAQINMDSTSNAEDKWFCKEPELTRGEVRATAKAIQVVLERSSDGLSDYTYMNEEVPGFISDLEKNLPILRELDTIFQEEVRRLKKIK